MGALHLEFESKFIMFDEVLAFVAGMITASIKVKNPSPRTYAWAFMIGVIVMGVGFLLALAIPMGLLPAIRLMSEKMLSPIGICSLLAGGVIGTCFIWRISSR